MIIQYLMRYAAMSVACLTQTNLPVFYKDKSGQAVAQPLRTLARALKENSKDPNTSSVFFTAMMMSNVGFTMVLWTPYPESSASDPGIRG